jgi:general secretion pathway protein I
MVARRRACRGFSLVETLVALAVVGAILGLVATAVRRGADAALRADRVEDALLVAQERLALAGVEETLAPGRSFGVADGRYRWDLAVEAVEPPQTPRGPAPKLFRVSVVVAWSEGRARRHVELATHRLLPVTP